MRLIAALVYLFAGMWLFFLLFPEGPFGLGLVLFFGLIFSAVPLFNKGLLRKLKGQSYAQYLEELEKTGKLDNVTLNASRAFYFDDLDTGSGALFLEVGNNAVLCLYGQHLYQFEPGADAAHPQRVFPSTQFTLRRLKRNREIVDIVPQGKSFEPAVIAQPPRRTLRALKIPLRDGDIYTHVKFHELFSEFSRLNS